MELRHVRYFVAVAEELNFRRAAELLSIAQPPLSQQIQDLEKELGVTLFYRTQRSVRLTAPGSVFLEDARQLLIQADESVRRVKKANLGKVGQLTIGYISLLHNPLFPRVLRLHRERYPEVELILRDLVTIEQMQQIRTNTLDVSFATHASHAITSLEQEALAQEPVWREPLGALLPKNHALASRSQVALVALAREQWIWFARPYDPTTYDYMMRLFEQVGFRPNITQEINQQQIILSLVEAGMGVSMAPRSAPGIRESQDIAYLELVDPTPMVEFNIIWRRDNISPVLKAFLETVREVTREADSSKSA